MSNNEIVKKDTIQHLQDSELLQLANTISGIVSKTKQGIATSVNTATVEAYWNIGKHIVEFEQQGEVRAKYGTNLLGNLAKVLGATLGKGFSRPNLQQMRKFYLTYPICQTVSGKLSWSHICELLKVDDELERSFYESECIAEHWSLRALRRQMDSGLFMRLALSKDKEGVLALAHEGVKPSDIQRPEDVVRDTYLVEFLGLPVKKKVRESELQQLLCKNMKTFLLELGKGFLFQEEKCNIPQSHRTTV